MTGAACVGVVRVIVAEDDPALLKIWSRELSRAGYEVTAVEDGQACIEKVADGGYDLIFCDIMMPQKDGLQVLAEAKAIDPDLEVILITGGATIERAVEAVRGGAADFLCKPIDDFEVLARVVKRTIERRQLRLENQRLVRELHELNTNLKDRVREQTEDLRRLYEDLKGLDRLKAEFLSLVSHELRTPVTGISGFMELLTENVIEEEEERTKALETVRRQAGRLEKIIEDIEWFLQLAAGKIEPERNRVDLKTLMEGNSRKWEPRMREKDISLQVEAPDSLSVHTDALLLENSLDRLLDNAVRFTEQGTVTLRLRSEDARVLLEVQDTGCGIDEVYHDRVLAPMTVAADIMHHQEGRGLGLSIVKRQIDLLGGEVEFESAGKDQGTTFRIALPIG